VYDAVPSSEDRMYGSPEVPEPLAVAAFTSLFHGVSGVKAITVATAIAMIRIFLDIIFIDNIEIILSVMFMIYVKTIAADTLRRYRQC